MHGHVLETMGFTEEDSDDDGEEDQISDAELQQFLRRRFRTRVMRAREIGVRPQAKTVLAVCVAFLICAVMIAWMEKGSESTAFQSGYDWLPKENECSTLACILQKTGESLQAAAAPVTEAVAHDESAGATPGADVD